MSRRSAPSLPDPADVVAGRVRARIEQLFALIHDVNPTDRKLAPRERAARYALKSKLQSLLVRDHADVLEVIADPTSPGVVSFRHRFAGRDAAHAVLAELEEDARRWAETQLVLGPAKPSPSSPPAKAARREVRTDSDALSLGHAALEEYDYDTARAHFTAALAQGGGVDGARALLDLLVNHLADDAGAIAVEPKLPKEALADVSVRATLAMAAARLGDRERATRLARGLTDPELLALLADLALRQGVLGDAQAHMVSLREADPANPALVRLAEGMDRLRRDARRPAEDRLAQAVGAGDLDGIEREARAVLARWPESEAARGAIRDVEVRRRRIEGRRAVERAWEAWSAADPEAVLVRAREARSRIDGDAELIAWLEEAVGAAREVLEARALESAHRALKEGDLSAGLRAYAALPPAARAAVRASSELPALGWLERLGHAQLEAVLALADANVFLSRDDAPAALARLLPYERDLRSLPEARALLAMARERVDSRARAATLAALDEAETAWLGGDLARARAALGRVDARHVDAKRHGELVRLLVAADDETRHRDDLERRFAGGDFAGARESARRLGEVRESDAPLRELNARIRRDWPIEVFAGVDVGTADMVFPDRTCTPAIWLEPEGERIVFASPCDGFVLVRVVELDMRVVETAVVVPVPVPFLFCVTQRLGDAVWIVGDRCGVIELARDSWEIRRWLPPPDDFEADGDTEIESVWMAQDGRHLWVRVSAEQQQVRVYDLGDWPRYRLVEPHGAVNLLLGGDRPAVAVCPETTGVRLYAPDGRSLSSRRVADRARVFNVALHPRGRHVVGFADARALLASGDYDPRADAELGAGRPLGMFIVQADGVGVEVSAYMGSDLGMRIAIATSMAIGRVYAMHRAGEVALVRASDFDRDPDPLVEASHVYLPLRSVLLTDAEGRRVRGITWDEAGLAPVDLDDGVESGREQEATEDAARQARLAGPSLDGTTEHHTCPAPYQVVSPSGDAIGGVIRKMGSDERRAWIADYRAAQAGKPEALYDLVGALAVCVDIEGTQATKADLLRLYPDYAVSRVFRAADAARQWEWDEAERILDGGGFEGLQPAMRQHVHHLRALARLHRGDTAAASEELRHALTVDARCRLDAVQGVLIALGALEPADLDSQASAVARFVVGVLDAGEALEAGDARGVVERLHVGRVLRVREVQSLARLAAAWLRVAPADDVERLSRRVALGVYRNAWRMRTESANGVELPLGPRQWSGERLAEVADACAAAIREGR